MKNISQKSTGVMLVILLLVTILGSSAYTLINLINNRISHLTLEAISALEWVNDNLPLENKLIVISDPHVLERAPQIARRTIINVPYGVELKPEERKIIDQFNVQNDNCKTLDCILSNLE